MTSVQLIECPRDAIQGWPVPVSTADKIAYYKALLDVGFHTLDIGSFVSHKAVPQMKDTRAVLNALDDEGKFECDTRVLVITANARGAKDAVAAPGVTHIGFPLSISNTFQLRNTGADIERAWERLQAIRAIAESGQMKLVVYLSMGFGNPYGDPWNVAVVFHWIEQLAQKGIRIISLSDTMGNADVSDINELFSALIPYYQDIEFGAHFHCAPLEWKQKLEAAFSAGCERFDTAIQGYGGCPMASNELVGNLPTEKAISFFTAQKAKTTIDLFAFESAVNQANALFSQYA